MSWHPDREPCTYANCTAMCERDWLLAEAADDIRETFYAIRQMEADRLHALDPITPHVVIVPAVVDYRL